MIVYFSASSREIKKDILKYRKILHKLYDTGHVVVNDWIEVSLHRSGRFGSPNGAVGWNINDIVRNAEAGIEQAEIVIAEASGRSTFGVGYEIATALRFKKPVLCLINEENAEDSYVTGITSTLLTVKSYNDRTIEKYLEDFIKDNILKNKDLRFNFVIDRQIYNHLRVKSFKSGKTKAEVIRDLLMKDIEQS